MTITSVITMFSAMVALAIIPDASAMAVAARSLSSGLRAGVLVIAGIILGDLIFIMFAVFGLSAIAVHMENLFIFIRYFGAVFLIAMAAILICQQPKSVDIDSFEKASIPANFLCGLLITLADPKAILFYISFFPAFIDLSEFQIKDIVIVSVTAIAALCCTKLVYAFLADKSRVLFKSTKAKKIINIIAGTVMLLTAAFLVIQV